MDPPPTPWSRLKRARIVRVVLVYLAASWVVIEVTSTLEEVLGLPAWLAPTAFVLLLAGLVVIAATAWVQSHPLLEARERAGEVPDGWEIGLGEIRGAIRQRRLPHLTWGRALLGGIVVFSLLFGAAGAYVLIGESRGIGPQPVAAEDAPAPGVAVLPFNVSAPELDLWREGMVDLLSRDLDGLGGLRGIDSRTVLARWDEAVAGGGRADLATMLEVGRRTGGRWALVGSVVGSERTLRLDADVYDVMTGAKVGSARAEGDPAQIMDAVDRLAVEVARVLLGGDAATVPIQHLASLTTSSLPALEAYLEGEAHYRRSEFDEAAERFREAVAEDSTFALAWVRLRNALGWVSPNSEEAIAAADRAVRGADRLPEREAVLIRARNGLGDGTLDEFAALGRAARRYPDDPELWAELGEYYAHYAGQVTASIDSAIDVMERAIELDPAFGPYYIHPVDLSIWAGDSARAARLLQAQRRVSPESEYHASSALAFDLVFGDTATRDSAWAEVDRRDPSRGLLWAAVALGAPRNSHVWESFERRLVRRGIERSGDLRWVLADRGELDSLYHLGGPSHGYDRHATFPSVLLGLLSLGLEVPADLMDRYVLNDPIGADGQNDDTGPLQLMARAAVAADRADARLFEATIARIEGRTAANDAAGDSIEARRWRGLGVALNGYQAWRSGDAAGAETAFARARPVVTGWIGNSSGVWALPAAVLRWWQARLAAEQGRPQEALRHYGSLLTVPPFIRTLGLYRQGELNEALGRQDDASRAYAGFVHAWEEADPDLQPLVAHARSRLAALAAEGDPGR